LKKISKYSHSAHKNELNDIILPENCIDIWFTPLLSDNVPVDRFQNCLSQDEVLRVSRLCTFSAKIRFAASRTFLRRILANYLKIQPAKVELRYDALGKPSLSETYQKSGICFNLSHSHGMALLGIAREKAVGVDIEKVRTVPYIDKIASRHFSPGEYTFFQGSPESKKMDVFFTLWTRKEALLKALGKGLTFPMHSIEVLRTPYESAHFFNGSGNMDHISEWHIEDIEICMEYRAALAVEGNYGMIRLFRYSGNDIF